MRGERRAQRRAAGMDVALQRFAGDNGPPRPCRCHSLPCSVPEQHLSSLSRCWPGTVLVWLLYPGSSTRLCQKTHPTSAQSSVRAEVPQLALPRALGLWKHQVIIKITAAALRASRTLVLRLLCQRAWKDFLVNSLRSRCQTQLSPRSSSRFSTAGSCPEKGPDVPAPGRAG